MAKQQGKAVVTFIDVLGFRELVKSEEPDYIYDIATHFIMHAGEDWGGDIQRDTNKYLKIEEKLPPLYPVGFSDSFVRIRFQENEDTFIRNCVKSELTSLCFMQNVLTKKGILIRGAVTIGDVCHDDKPGMVFGKAIVRASDLESKLANYPRIILDPKIDWNYEINKQTLISDSGDSFRRDFDQINYIDFLYENSFEATLRECSYEDDRRYDDKILQSLIATDIERLSNFREHIDQFIIQQISKKVINEKIATKYAWIFDHYNLIIDNVVKAATFIKYDGELPKHINIDLFGFMKND